MRIAILTETQGAETRVAATPDTAKKFIGLGASVVIQAGAGLASGIADADYAAAGAEIAGTATEALKDADIVLKVRRPAEAEAKAMKAGAPVVATMDAHGNAAALEMMAEAGVAGIAVGIIPRATRRPTWLLPFSPTRPAPGPSASQ